jgi:ElaA protein
MFDPMESARPAARPPAATPRWQWSRLPGLTPAALYAALAARQQVFAVEQQCAYLDADGLDHHAWHLLGWERAQPGALVAYLRVIDPGIRCAEPSIGRVLTLAALRGTGQGRALMREGIAGCASLHPGAPIRISAQRHLESFYVALGFATVSPPYDEDGIPHVEMLLREPPESSSRVDSPPTMR